MGTTQTLEQTKEIKGILIVMKGSEGGSGMGT